MSYSNHPKRYLHYEAKSRPCYSTCRNDSAGRMLQVTKTAEEVLEDLAAELEIPPYRYEAAEKRYKSLGAWLERPASRLASFKPEIYPQGSFRLGTATKPADSEEHYDLDVVCELAIGKSQITQANLKIMLGEEIEGYAERYSMAEPGESRRCWTLDYEEGAQFHMDVLPAVPDGARQRQLLEVRAMDATWSGTAIAITDRDHKNFRVVAEDWPSSNPKAYSTWFRNRMRVLLETRKAALAHGVFARAEDIPDYKVKTPLQQAIQILKRHRDVTFADRPDERPISVILTTLAAKSYRQEGRISDALFSILARMEDHIETRHEMREGKLKTVHWVANPTDPRENFADRWEEFPERKVAFDDWLRLAKEDFGAAAQAHATSTIVETLSPRLGRQLVERAARRRHSLQATPPTALANVGTRTLALVQRIRSAPHRKAAPWNDMPSGAVRIARALYQQQGYRPKTFASAGPPLPRRADLTFEAATTIRRPFRVYWQVTNTGTAALSVPGGGRGDFNEGQASRGKLVHHESTLYAGSHGIECFIVRDGKMLARSGVFVVNIE